MHFKSVAEKNDTQKKLPLQRVIFWTFYKTNKRILRCLCLWYFILIKLEHFFGFTRGCHTKHDMKQIATFWNRHLSLFVGAIVFIWCFLTVSICLLCKGYMTFRHVEGPRDNTQSFMLIKTSCIILCYN